MGLGLYRDEVGVIQKMYVGSQEYSVLNKLRATSSIGIDMGSL